MKIVAKHGRTGATVDACRGISGFVSGFWRPSFDSMRSVESGLVEGCIYLSVGILLRFDTPLATGDVYG